MRKRAGTQIRASAGDAITAKAAEKAAVLGNPTSCVMGIASRVGVGFVQQLEHGAVYYSIHTGAHEVEGAIGVTYRRMGGPNGPGQVNLLALGYPTTDETVALDGEGRISDFEHGSIYWHERTGPTIVHEAIKGAYEGAG